MYLLQVIKRVYSFPCFVKKNIADELPKLTAKNTFLHRDTMLLHQVIPASRFIWSETVRNADILLLRFLKRQKNIEVSFGQYVNFVKSYMKNLDFKRTTVWFFRLVQISIFYGSPIKKYTSK